MEKNIVITLSVEEAIKYKQSCEAFHRLISLQYKALEHENLSKDEKDMKRCALHGYSKEAEKLSMVFST